MDERERYEHNEKQAREASGPRYESDVGNRNTDQQAHEQRKRSRTSEQYINEKVDERGKRRH